MKNFVISTCKGRLQVNIPDGTKIWSNGDQDYFEYLGKVYTRDYGLTGANQSIDIIEVDKSEFLGLTTHRTPYPHEEYDELSHYRNLIGLPIKDFIS